MTEEIKKAIEEKIKELERKNNLRSLEVIEWLKWLLAKLPEEKKEVVVKEVKVEVPEKVNPTKRKISFKKK